MPTARSTTRSATEGTTTTSITGLTDVAHAVALQADGRIVVAGEGNLVNPNFALARYNTDGTLDTSFAIDGKLVVDFFGLEDRAENVRRAGRRQDRGRRPRGRQHERLRPHSSESVTARKL